jgi:hypothetical protein
MSKLQEKPLALKREQPTLKKINFFYFFYVCGSFFALLDPDTDPGTPIELGSTTLEFLYIFLTFRRGIFLPSLRRDTRLKQWAR